MTGTNRHCLRLLDAVSEAGNDPELAYVARIRLRRALLALERGPRSARQRLSGPYTPENPELAERAKALQTRVLHLCQPSEALDQRWRREWAVLEAETAAMRRSLAAEKLEK